MKQLKDTILEEFENRLMHRGGDNFWDCAITLLEPNDSGSNTPQYSTRRILFKNFLSLSLDKIFQAVEVKPEQLHTWYLEAVKELHPESFNPNANKPYSELTDEQRFIDKYISDKINQQRK